MRETIELRVEETEAWRLFREDEGVVLPSGTVRKVTLPTDDGRVSRVREIDRALRQQGQMFFAGWRILRHYSAGELKSAELLKLGLEAVFEPTGEACGTAYDESTACTLCGAGARQVSDLSLDVRRIPQRVDLARTLAHELIISARLADLWRENRITGVDFRPIRRAGARSEPVKEWHQLIVTAPPVDILPATLTGNDPFDHDEDNAQRCPKGHVVGLNVLSELSLRRGDYDGSDLTWTRQLVGMRSGVLRPHPLLLMSPKLHGLLTELKVKRLDVEVAHLV
ncbi:hypothetical protein FJV41_24740 [Myxococcus llanfairpwllgwyngyllgogerychwyrndrobwllllantysiliogogogochensis]|uniref:Uncharacterized protein n=1 Tax=Myxococcus llanfairpwllgwyngyllgogerychwyrndrobwllllantysiliogogogochensis TaxID=2590453 RepID=A0A540WW93_9BACT|nr:hypothetical protein FJV41_24740 [Myxococcus llanfairpwllgwyngyllgogerychwyrndrobwllllantysiliogogogochensis]